MKTYTYASLGRKERIPSFAPFESSLETTKSASAKRHPGEKEYTGEETIRPQRRIPLHLSDLKNEKYLVTNVYDSLQLF